jgi:hypothetical protein
MIGSGNGGIPLASPSGWAEIVFCHHSLTSFVVDTEMAGNTAMPIGGMLMMKLFNFLF